MLNEISSKRSLRWALTLTQAGLGAERVLRCFWPLWVAAATVLALHLSGAIAWIPDLWWMGVRGAAVLALLAAALWGGTRFRLPRRAEAVARLDATLPGRPLAALADTQAIGASDMASRALWQAHQQRMAHQAARARAPGPNLRLSARDPFGLRYLALLFLTVTLLFGSVIRVSGVTPAGQVATSPTGPSWEGWAEPPAYTKRPSLYLNDLDPGTLSLPAGTRITLRFYGETGAAPYEQTVSDMPQKAEDGVIRFSTDHSGLLRIGTAAPQDWQIDVVTDMPPLVEISGEFEATASGEMRLPFLAQDDYAIRQGSARITLNLSEVPRVHGRAPEPASHPVLELDLPMPFTGDRADFEEILTEDLSKHAFANLPVQISLQVVDDAGLSGNSGTLDMVLPGRRFFQPTAAAIAELRQDLLWSPENGRRVAQILRALAWRGDDHLSDPAHRTRLDELIAALDVALASADLSADDLIGLTDHMWDFALELEEGALADAKARLERAQQRLAEAMRNGASDAEIADLMQELRAATDDYLQMLANQATPEETDGTDQPDRQEDQRNIRQDEIQNLMDEIEKLMQEGRMEEAARLMEQLNALMQNLEIRPGEGDGNGPRIPGQQSLDDMGQSLRDQQRLSDDAFRELQEQFSQNPGQPGAPSGAPDQEAPNGAPGQGEGETGTADSLSERQKALKDEIARQRQALPRLPSDEADRAAEALDRAARAMEQAQEALGAQDLPSAIDNQSQAMDALRDSMRALRDALDAETEARNQGATDMPGSQTGALRPERRDPLGRQRGGGEGGEALQSDGTTLDQDSPRARGQELMDELRRRQQDRSRPEQERDYIDRLLDRF